MLVVLTHEGIIRRVCLQRGNDATEGVWGRIFEATQRVFFIFKVLHSV